ncbi:MAG: hypothetical protein AAGF31_02530 [Planctomycetota bacterium]
MSTAVPSHLVAVCPGCGKRSRVHAVHAGRRTRCKQCGETFRIPSADDPESFHETVDQREPHPPEPAKHPPVGFECRVCQTRMTVPAKYIGRKVKCPDCGAATVVSPPPEPRKLDIPAAIFGDQYEVFEGEDQPWAADIAAQQPQWLPVHCRHCQTLMHAQPHQIGQQLTCPDCGVATTVRPPEDKPPAIDVTVEAYDISPPEVTDGLTEAARAYLSDVETIAAAEVEAQPLRPELPRLPLVSGVTRMLRTGGMIGRSLVIAAWATTAVCLLRFGVDIFTGAGGGFVSSGAGAIMGACLAMLGFLIGLLSFGYFATLAISIVTESSEGSDKLHDPPSTNPIDWMGETLTLGVAAMAAAAPGWIVGQLVSGEFAVAAAAGLLSLCVCLPVVLLSQLDIGSPWAVVSPRLVRSLARLPGTCLLLTVESLLLLAVPAAAAFAIDHFGYGGIILAAAPLMFAALGYFRLIGRLAWVVAERTSVEFDPAGDAN